MMNTAPGPRAVVFDLDGTLLDSRHAVLEAVEAGFRDVLARHGITDVEPRREMVASSMGLPAGEYFRRILPRKLQHLADEVQAAATGHEVEALASGRGRLFAGITELLEALATSGRPVAIVSNSQTPYFRAAVQYTGLERWAQHLECHEELPTPGGKVELLTRALEALSCDPSQSAMVGDRAGDVDAGRGLGCATVGVTYGFGDPGELRGADVIVHDVPELSRALL